MLGPISNVIVRTPALNEALSYEDKHVKRKPGHFVIYPRISLNEFVPCSS